MRDAGYGTGQLSGATIFPAPRVESYLDVDRRAAMIDEVGAGLTARPKSLPPKYLYDERGARLFEQICELPEYYPTRTEEAILAAYAGEIIEACGPDQIVELGSGSSRKTRLLLDELVAREQGGSYVPVDVSEQMLRHSAVRLQRDYPALAVHAIAGDYERHLRHVPPARSRMVIFLGSSIGNFTDSEGRRFLRSVRRQLTEGDAFLIGFDLLKPVSVLHAAYNDNAGVTAEFNRNVLRVLNRELGARFNLDGFVHDAFFHTVESQIEMHLRAVHPQRVWLGAVGLAVDFAAGESIRTEISRKFSRDSAETLLAAGGFAPQGWYQSADGYFALALALAGSVV